MGRSTVYNKGLTTKEKWEQVSEENKELYEDFLSYCKSADKSQETIRVYKNGLKIFFCWNVEFNRNKFFVDIKIKDILLSGSNFQDKCRRLVKKTLKMGGKDNVTVLVVQV